MAFVEKQVNDFLERLLSVIDVSEDAYGKATERYRSVGQFLCRDESSVQRYKPQIYPQGSFLLGTVVRPMSDEEDYDIDLVCELQLTKEAISQKDLKELAGVELRKYIEHEKLGAIKEGRRCWTLDYSDVARFHLDVLPSIPDQAKFEELLRKSKADDEFRMKLAESAIAITDKDSSNFAVISPDWLVSNPLGYDVWFRGRMKVQFENQRKQLAETLKKSVDDVPEHLVKTPLQRVVQLLKRHRDICFRDAPEYKPISIIITTLAAQAYQNEASILDALINVATKMPKYISKLDDGTFWISNPVNPAENFADRWADDQRLIQVFFAWLGHLETSLIQTLTSDGVEKTAETLKIFLGEKAVTKALNITPAGEIGLREVSLIGAKLPVDRIEITEDLFCPTVGVKDNATVGEILKVFGERRDMYVLIFGENNMPLAIVRPDHIASWLHIELDEKLPALAHSDKEGAYVTSTLETEFRALMRLKRILIEHESIVVRANTGNWGVLDKFAWGTLMERIEDVTTIIDFFILPPHKAGE